MRVIKTVKRKYVPRRGKRMNYTTMRAGTKTERGTIGKCSSCGEKGAVRLNKAMGMQFVTHHALIRPDGEYKVTVFCLEQI